MLRFNIFSSVCVLGGLKEENMGVGMRWHLFTPPITTSGLRNGIWIPTPPPPHRLL